MEKFLLLIREDLRKLDNTPKEIVDREIQEMTRWVEALSQSGNFASGEPLHTTGRYVSRNSVMSDGPFIEAKEAVSGYIFVRAENLEQATSIAQTCPLVIAGKVVVEVRPIMELDAL